MDATSFARTFPTLFHLTFASNLPSIRQHGLLSARDLANTYHFSDQERTAVLLTRRRCIQSLHGIDIRDQHAMQEAKMKSCLVKITVEQWLELLNARIFFFLSRNKALQFADVYSDYNNVLLEVDTHALLQTSAPATTLCRINSGSFLYNPRPRGRDSFIPLSAFSYKNKRDTPAELTVSVAIPNILDISSATSLSA